MPGERGLADGDGHVVWEEDSWDDARAIEAAAALAGTGPILPAPRAVAAGARVAVAWDTFFRHNSTHFFKDRAWLERDFPELHAAASAPLTLLEFGCGVGNAFVPLVQRLPHVYVTAFDVSRRAVELIADIPEPALATRAVVFAHNALAGGVGAAVRAAHAAFLARLQRDGADAATLDAVTAVWCRTGAGRQPAEPPSPATRAALLAWLLRDSDGDRGRGAAGGGGSTSSGGDASGASGGGASGCSAPSGVGAECGGGTDDDNAWSRHGGGFDVALMLFMASAVPPSTMQGVFVEAAANLRPGGTLLFRDYGAFDAAELRFKPGQRLGTHLFARSDGTLAAFFTVEQLRRWAAGAGLEVTECRYLFRRYANRALNMSLRRVFVHAVFSKPSGHDAAEYAAAVAAGSSGGRRG